MSADTKTTMQGLYLTMRQDGWKMPTAIPNEWEKDGYEILLVHLMSGVEMGWRRKVRHVTGESSSEFYRRRLQVPVMWDRHARDNGLEQWLLARFQAIRVAVAARTVQRQLLA